MAENPALTIVQRFTYRGNGEEFSNKYHFVGDPPADGAAWKTLVDAVAAQVKTIFPSDVKIVRAYCYDDGSADSVYTVDYTALGAEIAGTLSPGGSDASAPGDAAMWARWLTPDRNSKGKPIYLRKYWHGVLVHTSVGNNDTIATGQHTALAALATHLADGSITGFTICGPTGATAGTSAVSTYATTRTLKRRGRRPPSGG